MLRAYPLTQPMDNPVMMSHSHQSNENGLPLNQTCVFLACRDNAPILLVMELGETESSKEGEEQ